ncbi:MAG: peptidoglycan editing factor PgeF [Lysobacter sp.]
MATAWLDADWPAPPSVRAFTTLRHGLGDSSPPFEHFNLGNRHAANGDDPATVERNRALLIEQAALPSRPHWLRQVHGIAVERVEGRSALGEPEADAAVTSVSGSVLAVLTADCLPVLFCAADGSEVAAAHAGWRGLAAGVLEATVAAMRTPAERVLAWLGPAAGPQHYEIGVEVYDAFVSQDWTAGRAFTSTRPHHWRVDLFALARQRLAKVGLMPDRIHGGGHCTIAEPQRFYSHRRDARTGRMASLVWIEPGR